MKFHLIYTESEVIVSTKPYASWREIQDEFSTYKASLGPWDELEIIDYLQDEYPLISPSAARQIEMLKSSQDITKTITFQATGQPKAAQQLATSHIRRSP